MPTITQGTNFYDPNTGANLGVVQYDPNTGQKLGTGQTAQYNYSNTGTNSNPVIQTSNIGTQPYTVPPVVPTPTVATELSSAYNQATAGVNQAQTGVTSAETERGQLKQDYQILADQLTQQTADTQAKENEVGLPALSKDLQDLINTSRTQTAQYIQGITQSETNGGLAANVNAKQSFLNRQYAVDAMLTNSLISAKQGDITNAQAQVDRAISLKYDPIKQQIQNKMQFLEMNYQDLSRADQKLADAKTKQWNVQMKQIETMQKEEENIQSIALEAAKLGASASDLSAITKATTLNEAIKLSAPFMASANNDIVRLDNGNTVLVNKLTGKVIKNLGGAKASDVIPKTIVRTVAGKPVDGYALQKGDDPYFIAQQYGVTMQELQAINPNISDWNNLQVGATINVPKSDMDAFTQNLLNTQGGKPLTDTTIQKLDKGLTVLSQLGVLQANVKDVKTGPIVGQFKGANPWDTNAQTIKASLNAIVPNLARGIYGEVGVLTDNDIKTYSKTLPNLTSTEAVRNAVLYITLDMIGKSISNTLNVNAAAGRDVSGFVDIYTEMQNTKNSILSTIPNAQVPQAFQSQNTDPFLNSFSPSAINSSINNSSFFNQLP